MKRILVTGANGYIGSHVANYLAQIPNIILTATDFKNSRLNKNVMFVSEDILRNADKEELYERLKKPEICIHLAWQDGFVHNADSHIDKLPAHFHFLKNLVEHGCTQLLVAGSLREYGSVHGKISEDAPVKADNYYAWSKISLKNLLDIYLKDKPVCLQWLRFFTPYGNDELNNSIFSKIIAWEKEGRKTFPFTEGKEQYDYIHIDDLTHQIAAVAAQTEISGVINCCSGRPETLKSKVEELIKSRNFKIRPEYGAFPSRSYDSDIIYGDNTKISKIMQLTGWRKKISPLD